MFALSTRIDEYPSCEFMTLNIGFSNDVDGRYSWDSYLAMLNLHYDIQQWKGSHFNNLILVQQDLAFHSSSKLTLVANKWNLFRGSTLDMNGGRNRHGFVGFLHSFNQSMVRWSLHTLLRYYELEYASLLQAATQAPNLQKLQLQLKAIASIEMSLLRLGGDSSAILPEVARICSEPRVFHRGVDEFVPMRPDVWNRDYKGQNSKYSKRFPLKMFTDLRRNSNADEAKDIPHFFEILREEMSTRCGRIQRMDELIRWLVQAESAVLNSRAQLRLAGSNYRLQLLVALLSIVVLMLTIVQVYFAWITSQLGTAFQSIFMYPM